MKLRSVLMVASAFAGGMATSQVAPAARGDDAVYRHLAVFARVLSYIENNYVTHIDQKELVYGAIRGMLATLDPNSSFVEPEQFAAMKSETNGAFGGIGVDIVKRKGTIGIVEIHPGSPAARERLKPGDQIISVGGQSVAGLSLSDVVRRIKGPSGSIVQLSLRRSTGVVEEISLERARIRLASVSFGWLESGQAQLRIKSFTDQTYGEVRRALAELGAQHEIRGLVIDLRDNPGGLLDEAVRIADLWLDKGIIVSTIARKRKPIVEWAHPKGTEPDYPVVVLVNGGSASAAEILAGALQDHGRAQIVGTQSFGKGSVQTVIELEDHSALKLTVARYFTPKHRSIQGRGITPDQIVVAPVTASGSDSEPQLAAAREILRRWARSR